MFKKPALPKKKRHHFVARSYLRSFSRRDMLWGWFRASNEIKDVHVDHVALEHGFYDLRIADGTACDELEDALAVFDGMTPRIVASAVAGSEMTEEISVGVRTLYATMLARNHQGRSRLIPEASGTLERVGRMYDDEFPESTPEDRAWALDCVMRDLYDVPEHFATDPDTISRLHILGLADELFMTMPKNVSVVRSSAQDFFTSDSPCSYFDPVQPPKPGVSSGPTDWSSPSLELTIPLDRRHVALISNRPTRGYVKMNLDGVRVVNARTAFYSKRVILACPTDDEEETALFVAQVATQQTAFDTLLLESFPLRG